MSCKAFVTCQTKTLHSDLSCFWSWKTTSVPTALRGLASSMSNSRGLHHDPFHFHFLVLSQANSQSLHSHAWPSTWLSPLHPSLFPPWEVSPHLRSVPPSLPSRCKGNDSPFIAAPSSSGVMLTPFDGHFCASDLPRARVRARCRPAMHRGGSVLQRSGCDSGVVTFDWPSSSPSSWPSTVSSAPSSAGPSLQPSARPLSLPSHSRVPPRCIPATRSALRPLVGVWPDCFSVQQFKCWTHRRPRWSCFCFCQLELGKCQQKPSWHLA